MIFQVARNPADAGFGIFTQLIGVDDTGHTNVKLMMLGPENGVAKLVQPPLTASPDAFRIRPSK